MKGLAADSMSTVDHPMSLARLTGAGESLWQHVHAPNTPSSSHRITPPFLETGVRQFQFEFSTQYYDIQAAFNECVASYDPNTINALLNRHPYHVDSMLQVSKAINATPPTRLDPPHSPQMSEFLRATGQTEEAAGVLRRCLYTLECAWHPLFKPWDSPPCRLPWAVIANRCAPQWCSLLLHAEQLSPLCCLGAACRGFFTALFRYSQLVGRAGCVHTAFELCRLLLHLDPATDPMRVLLCIGTQCPVMHACSLGRV